MGRLVSVAALLLALTVQPALLCAAEKRVPQPRIGKTEIGKTEIGKHPGRGPAWTLQDRAKRFGRRIKHKDLNYRRERCGNRASGYGLHGLEHQKFLTACMFPW